MMQSASFWCCQFNIVSDDFDFQKPAFLPTREEQITCALGPEMAQATKPSLGHLGCLGLIRNWAKEPDISWAF